MWGWSLLLRHPRRSQGWNKALIFLLDVEQQQESAPRSSPAAWGALRADPELSHEQPVKNSGALLLPPAPTHSRHPLLPKELLSAQRSIFRESQTGMGLKALLILPSTRPGWSKSQGKKDMGGSSLSSPVLLLCLVWHSSRVFASIYLIPVKRPSACTSCPGLPW